MADVLSVLSGKRQVPKHPEYTAPFEPMTQHCNRCAPELRDLVLSFEDPDQGRFVSSTRAKWHDWPAGAG
jgi:hypothetical protein